MVIDWLIFFTLQANEINRLITVNPFITLHFIDNYLNDLSITGFSYGYYSHRPHVLLAVVSIMWKQAYTQQKKETSILW